MSNNNKYDMHIAHTSAHISNEYTDSKIHH